MDQPNLLASSSPAIVDNPPDNARLVTEEPLAPISPLLKWPKFDSASVIDRAHNTDTGLGASVWSKDVEKATAMASQLEAGTVRVNTHFELEQQLRLAGIYVVGLGLSLAWLG